MSYKQVYLWHMVMIGPLLTYIGHNMEKTHVNAFNALGLLTLLIPFVVRIPKNKLTFHNLVLLGHHLIWVPLFLYVAYKKTELSSILFPFILYLGLSVIAIHSYLLYKSFML